MAIALVQTKTAVATGTSVSATFDTAPTVGNTMVAAHYARGTDATAPAGWESFQKELSSSTNPLTIAWRVVQSGDTGATFAQASAESCLIVAEYSGLLSVQADLGDQQMAATTDVSTDITTISTSRTGTTDATSELAVAAVACLGSNTWSGTWTDSFTQRATAASSAGASSKAVLAYADRTVSAIGDYETSTSWTTARRALAAIVTLRAAAAATDPVIWSWPGAATDTSITVAAQVAAAVDCRLGVSTSSDLSSPTYSSVVTAQAGDENVVKLTLSGLTADTQYYYAVEADSVLSPVTGKFKTFPAPGAASFTFAIGACGGYRDNASGDTQVPMSTHPVWDRVEEHDPLFFLHMGDLHYQDVNTASTDDHSQPFYDVLTSAKQGPLWRRTNIAYMWDDHDYCGNDTFSSATGQAAARAAYRRCVPHYAIDSRADGSMHQAFTVGRVRFILLDTRSAASSRTATDNSSKTKIGADGRQWLLDELAAAEADTGIGLVVIDFSTAWISTSGNETDWWSAYGTERDLIAAQVDGMTTAVMGVGGDMHALAIDDGTNNTWGDFPVFHAAAMGRDGSTKGGPYSSGVFENHATLNDEYGQYGLVTVTDAGSQITISCSGKRVTRWGTESEVVAAEFVFDAPSAPARPTYYSRAKVP